MALGISANIEAVRQEVLDGTLSGFDLAMEGISAIQAGMGSEEWATLMNRFAKTPKELDRLCGRDQQFNDMQWGPFCLAYIVGDSTCTSDTSMQTGTHRSMNVDPSREMAKVLDEEFV